MSRSRACSSLIAALLLAACGEAAGHVSFVYVWLSGAPPTNLGQVYPRVRLLQGTQQIATVEPPTGQTSVDLPAIPNGTGYTMFVELLDAPGSAGQVLYYGASAPFAMQAGQTTTVTVSMQPVPSLLPDAQGGAARVETATGLGATNSSMVQLVLLTDTGVAVNVSNVAGFPPGGAAQLDVALDTPATDVTAPVGFHAFQLPWDLSSGVSLTCAAQAGCTRSVYVQFVDAHGETSAVTVATTTFDTVAPALSFSSVSYTPGPGNPLAVVSGATVGTTVTIQATGNEPLDPNTAATFTIADGANVLATGVVQSTTFSTVIPAGAIAGTYTATVTLTDLAGNTSTPLPIPEPIVVQTTMPALTVDQSQLLYVRSPWGSDIPETIDGGSVTIPAGPWFSLGPDPLSGQASLPASTFTGTTGTPSMIRVWSDQQPPVLLASMTPSPSGEWPAVSLPPIDAVAVSVTLVDEVGNESAPVQVATVEWVATPNNSPHTLVETNCFPVAASSQALTSTGVTATAELPWVERTPAYEPNPLSALAMAYDSARGRTVLFGGSSPDVVVMPTVEWDGVRWIDPTPPLAPSNRSGSAMAYDVARGRSVLFGGTQFSDLQDTWEWDGSTWLQVPVTDGPSARHDHAMAYDSGRARTVLFGGATSQADLSDTWEWDGVTWTQQMVAGPSARSAFAMAYDSIRARTVLFGGHDASGGEELQDTWEWDGTSWMLMSSTGAPPPARDHHSMAYDSAAQVTVLFGGFTGSTQLADTWTWNGTTWTQSMPAMSPSPRSIGAMAYDAGRQKIFFYGGYDGSTLGDLWQWDGSDWMLVVAPGQSLGERTPAGMVFDTTLNETILFGGLDSTGLHSDLWAWNGAHWNFISSSGGPSPRLGSSVTYDGTRRRLVVFGGLGGISTAELGGPFEWDGTSWHEPSVTGMKPADRNGAAAAWDSLRDRMLMFGGAGYTTWLGDLWAWNGTSWTQLTSAPSAMSPAARTGSGLAYDVARDRAVLFGGSSPGLLDDTWEWDGTQWLLQSPANSPPARTDFSMAYDSTRQRTVVFGGEGANSTYLGDSWEWDGQTWTDVTPSGGPSPRQAAGLTYDSPRNRMVLFGGTLSTSLSAGDTWEREGVPSCEPAVELDVDGSLGGWAVASVIGVRVRASCSGSPGVSLYGWNMLGLPQLGGPFTELETGDGPFDWQASSVAEAQAYVVSDTQRLSFQCRSTGEGETSDAGPTDGGANDEDASVTLGRIEARVRYQP